MERLTERYSIEALEGLARAIIERTGFHQSWTPSVMSVFDDYLLPSPEPAPTSPDLDRAAKEYNPKAGDLTDIPVKRLQDLEACYRQAVEDKSAHSDTYLLGYANGIILAHAIMHGVEPAFIDPRKPEVDRLVPRYHAEDGEFGEGATVRSGRPGRAYDDAKPDPLDVLKMEDLGDAVTRDRFMSEASRMVADAFDRGFRFAVQFSDLYRRSTRE